MTNAFDALQVFLLTSFLVIVLAATNVDRMRKCSLLCQVQRRACRTRCESIGLCNRYIEKCKNHCDGLATDCVKLCYKEHTKSIPNALLRKNWRK